MNARKQTVRQRITRASGWFTSTTWHGISDAYQAVGIGARMFWCVALMLSLAMLIYQLYYVVQGYVKGSKYTTSLSTQQNGTVIFPNITLCNFNRANATKLQQIGMDNSALSYLFLSLVQNYITSSYLQNTSDQLRFAYQNFARNYSGSTQVVDLINFLGHDCNATLIMCFWDGITYPCCDPTYVNTVINNYGKCYSVVPPTGFPWGAGNPPVQNLPGPVNALSLVIDPGLNYSSNAIYNNFMSSGSVLIVDDTPENFMANEVIALDPGTTVFLAVQATEISTKIPVQLVFPLPCRTNAALEIISARYSSGTCTTDCFAQTVNKYCKCIFPVKTNRTDLRVCMPLESDCVTAVYYGIQSEFVTAWMEAANCSLTCNDPCDSHYVYSTSVSVTHTLGAQKANLYNFINQLYPWADAQNLIQLFIYYPVISTTIMDSAERESVFDLLSNIGGQLGMWGGISVLTIAQMVHFCSLCCCANCCRRRTANPPPTLTNVQVIPNDRIAVFNQWDTANEAARFSR